MLDDAPEEQGRYIILACLIHSLFPYLSLPFSRAFSLSKIGKSEIGKKFSSFSLHSFATFLLTFFIFHSLPIRIPPISLALARSLGLSQDIAFGWRPLEVAAMYGVRSVSM